MRTQKFAIDIADKILFCNSVLKVVPNSSLACLLLSPGWKKAPLTVQVREKIKWTARTEFPEPSEFETYEQYLTALLNFGNPDPTTERLRHCLSVPGNLTGKQRIDSALEFDGGQLFSEARNLLLELKRIPHFESAEISAKQGISEVLEFSWKADRALEFNMGLRKGKKTGGKKSRGRKPEKSPKRTPEEETEAIAMRMTELTTDHCEFEAYDTSHAAAKEKELAEAKVKRNIFNSSSTASLTLEGNQLRLLGLTSREWDIEIERLDKANLADMPSRYSAWAREKYEAFTKEQRAEFWENTNRSSDSSDSESDSGSDNTLTPSKIGDGMQLEEDDDLSTVNTENSAGNIAGTAELAVIKIDIELWNKDRLSAEGLFREANNDSIEGFTFRGMNSAECDEYVSTTLLQLEYGRSDVGEHWEVQSHNKKKRKAQLSALNSGPTIPANPISYSGLDIVEEEVTFVAHSSADTEVRIHQQSNQPSVPTNVNMGGDFSSAPPRAFAHFIDTSNRSKPVFIPGSVLPATGFSRQNQAVMIDSGPRLQGIRDSYWPVDAEIILSLTHRRIEGESLDPNSDNMRDIMYNTLVSLEQLGIPFNQEATERELRVRGAYLANKSSIGIIVILMKNTRFSNLTKPGILIRCYKRAPPSDDPSAPTRYPFWMQAISNDFTADTVRMAKPILTILHFPMSHLVSPLLRSYIETQIIEFLGVNGIKMKITAVVNSVLTSHLDEQSDGCNKGINKWHYCLDIVACKTTSNVDIDRAIELLRVPGALDDGIGRAELNNLQIRYVHRSQQTARLSAQLGDPDFLRLKICIQDLNVTLPDMDQHLHNYTVYQGMVEAYLGQYFDEFLKLNTNIDPESVCFWGINRTSSATNAHAGHFLLVLKDYSRPVTDKVLNPAFPTAGSKGLAVCSNKNPWTILLRQHEEFLARKARQLHWKHDQTKGIPEINLDSYAKRLIGFQNSNYFIDRWQQKSIGQASSTDSVPSARSQAFKGASSATAAGRARPPARINPTGFLEYYPASSTGGQYYAPRTSSSYSSQDARSSDCGPRSNVLASFRSSISLDSSVPGKEISAAASSISGTQRTTSSTDTNNTEMDPVLAAKAPVHTLDSIADAMATQRDWMIAKFEEQAVEQKAQKAELKDSRETIAKMAVGLTEMFKLLPNMIAIANAANAANSTYAIEAQPSPTSPDASAEMNEG